MKKIFPLISLLLISAGIRAQESDVMPVVAYLGVPQLQTTAERYLEMKECGINTNLTKFTELEHVVEAVRLCEEVGMMIIPECNKMYEHPEAIIPLINDSPALLAYFVRDEPFMKDLENESRKLALLKENGATKPGYINLNPYYNDEFYLDQGLSSYKEYVEKCVDALDTDFISFDFYPILNNGDSIRTTWYENMKIIRDESVKTGKPFWGFVMSVPHFVYSEPTVEDMRLQISVNLAYGAQAIQYFTYWRAPETDHNYHDGPIDKGNKTAMYYKLQQVNSELAELAPYFYKGQITKVKHVKNGFKGAKIDSTDGAIGSLLTTAEGEGHIVLVNKSTKNGMSVTYKGENHHVLPGGLLLL